jgi:NAD(P)-dependent dehydrogenase (short-subunit alcohol dehydrogenase family)
MRAEADVQKVAQRQPTALRFTGKVALVSGASDRGIGGAIAERLAEEGAAVSLFGLDEPTRLMDRLAQDNAEVCYAPCDVTCQQDVDRVVGETLRLFGRIDVVVNNAGEEIAEPFEHLTDDAWARLIDVNLSGVMRLSRASLPALKKRGGAIVNIASASALGGTPGLAAYSAAKAGVIGLTQTLAMELAPHAVRVVALAPALVKTPMATKHIAQITRETWEKIQAVHPLGIGRPQDVAAAVAFLASDEARWITGITLPMGWCPGYPLPNVGCDHGAGGNGGV